MRSAFRCKVRVENPNDNPAIDSVMILYSETWIFYHLGRHLSEYNTHLRPMTVIFSRNIDAVTIIRFYQRILGLVNNAAGGRDDLHIELTGHPARAVAKVHVGVCPTALQ